MHKPFYPELCKRYEDFDFKRKSLISKLLYYFTFDQNGIIHLQFTALEGGKKRYFPITVQQYALMQYNQYAKTHSPAVKEAFLKHADWLLQSLKIKGKLAYWPYTWPMRIAGYAWRKPYDWASCIAQGQGLSVLIRAHSLTKNIKYLTLVKNILRSFETDYRISGGVLEVDEQGNKWYLEFPATLKHGRVLNGLLYSLIGLYEYYSYTKDKQAKSLFEAGKNTIAANLDHYDLDYGFFKWSRYDDQQIFYTGRRYHLRVLLPQLKILYKITSDKRFKRKYEQWKQWAEHYALQSKLLDLPLLAIQKLRAYLPF